MPRKSFKGGRFWVLARNLLAAGNRSNAISLASEKVGREALFRLVGNHKMLCHAPRSPQQAVVGWPLGASIVLEVYWPETIDYSQQKFAKTQKLSQI